VCTEQGGTSSCQLHVHAKGPQPDGLDVSGAGRFRLTQTTAALVTEQQLSLLSVTATWARLGAKRNNSPGTTWVCYMLKGGMLRRGPGRAAAAWRRLRSWAAAGSTRMRRSGCRKMRSCAVRPPRPAPAPALAALRSRRRGAPLARSAAAQSGGVGGWRRAPRCKERRTPVPPLEELRRPALTPHSPASCTSFVSPVCALRTPARLSTNTRDCTAGQTPASLHRFADPLCARLLYMRACMRWTRSK